MAMNTSEQAVLAHYRKTGDLKALGDLYSGYMPLVYGVCLTYLKDRDRSQDAVMDIFESLVTKLKEHEVQNFKSWLHVVTRNHCLMILRSSTYKRESEKRQDITMEFELPVHHENGRMPEEDMEALKICIEKLKDEQKQCVSMFFLEELSYRQITEKTRYDMNKVKSHIQNGKRNMKACIENYREKQG